MSEQQSQAATATATTANHSEPASSDPTPERQAELRTAYEANIVAGRPPYKRVTITTRGELQWLLRERGWSGRPALPEGMQRPDLREVDLAGADLGGAILHGADLSEARLTGTNLRISGLTGAVLQRADLRMANLARADLQGADLREAQLDRQTQLAEVKLDSKTRLGDIDWQGVTLTRVHSWPPRLGEEDDIFPDPFRGPRIRSLRVAARAYRGLGIALRGQGLLIPASNYRLREQVLERKASLLSGNLLGWTFSWLLYLVAGYGERPVRSFFAYLLVLFGFAGAYLALGTGQLAGFGLGTHDAISNPVSALVFSVTSFHGRGFFPGGLALDDPITVLAAAEAVIGLFIEITFIGAIRSLETVARRRGMRGIPTGVTTGGSLTGANSCPSW